MNIYAGSMCAVCARVARESDLRPYHRCSKCQNRLKPNIPGDASEKASQSSDSAEAPRERNAYARYNNFWRRLLAGLIDAFALALFATALHFAAGKLNVEAAGFLGIATVLMYPLYAIVLHSRYGRTIGKAIMQLRVVDQYSQQLISFKRSVLRSLVPAIIAVVLSMLHLAVLSMYWIDYSIDFSLQIQLAMAVALAMLALAITEGGWYTLELITMLSNKKRQALHDLLAGSVVVKSDGASEYLQS